MRSSRRAGYRRHLDQNSCQWSDSRCARTASGQEATGSPIVQSTRTFRAFFHGLAGAGDRVRRREMAFVQDLFVLVPAI